MTAKHEVHYPSNAKIMKVVLSCHGNQASKTASTTRYCCCPRGHMFQIWGLYAINSKPMKIYGYKVSIVTSYTIALVDNSTKFEVYTPSDSNATTVCFC